MTTQHMVENWMASVGLAKSALMAHEQRCCFKANGHLEMSIEWPPASDDLFLVVKLLPVQSGPVKNKRLEEAMRLNAYSLVTRGATIGWDEAHDQLVLSYRMDREWTDAARLGRAVGNLCEIAVSVYESLRLSHEEVIARDVDAQVANWFEPVRA